MTDHPLSQHDPLVAEQIAYYEARAPEYDRMLERSGHYDLDGLDPASVDPETRELGLAEAALQSLAPLGEVLEIACGTGWWTRRLAPLAASVTALDASPTMLAINQARGRPANVRLVNADIFAWSPDRAYDTIFFAFWLSHVPTDRFEEFWMRIGAALSPTGRVFYIDEMAWDGREDYEQASGDERGTTWRALEDGRRFRMVKVYHQPAALDAQLSELGWSARTVPAGERRYRGLATRGQTAGHTPAG